jgi:DNA adenine methylase
LKQLIKYIGNKNRYAERIISYFPKKYKNYFEPFLGSGAVLAALKPNNAIAADSYNPLIQLFKLVKNNPNIVLKNYETRWNKYIKNKKETFEKIKKNFNQNNNPHDYLFLTRSCYGGVMRFRKDGYYSTPIGIHTAITPVEFSKRLYVWSKILKNVHFYCSDYKDILLKAKKGDIVYCDPPYVDSQKIIYGAQKFNLQDLFNVLKILKKRKVFFALSIDGSKKSKNKIIDIKFPKNLFEQEIYLSGKGSMLKRFQRLNSNVNDEQIEDRLLLSEKI